MKITFLIKEKARGAYLFIKDIVQFSLNIYMCMYVYTYMCVYVYVHII